MRDSSIVASLDELKLIHVARLAEERAAIDRARIAREAEASAREQAARAADEARRRGELAEERARHEAREAAERDARMRVENARVLEQTRLAAELAAERDAGERALRREAILRQRPRWMIALTIAATIGAIAFAFSAVSHERDVQAAEAREALAQQQVADAKRDARAAQAQVEQLEAKLAELHDAVDRAITQVANAKQAADRQAALDALAAAKKKLADAELARAEARRRRDEAIRKGGIHTGADCTKGVLDCIGK